MVLNKKLFKKIITTQKTGNMVQKKVAIYSHSTMVILRYLQLSYPKFSRSKAAKEILIEHAKKNHPELWEKILSEIPYKRDEENNEQHIHEKGYKLDHPKTKILIQAYSETLESNNKILTIYSPQLSAFYDYLKNTIPRFSASSYGAKILEEEIEKEYSVLWNKVQKQMAK